MVIVAQFSKLFKFIKDTKYCVIQGIESIPCPICGGRLYHYDTRDRSVRIDEERHYHLMLRRLHETSFGIAGLPSPQAAVL